MYIILTHSCSVSIDDYIKEPYAEYIMARPLRGFNPAYIGRKHPRILHIPMIHQGQELWFELSICDRSFFDRRVLNNFAPSSDYLMPENSASQVIRWITARYDAPAFPDEFNIRLDKSSRDKIAKKLKETAITGVYIGLEPHDAELESGEDYSVELIITTDIDLSGEQEKKCKQIAQSVKVIVEDCEGISLEGSGVVVVSEEDLTLADLRNIHLMQFDYLSEREKPGGLLPQKG
ncbi:MAG: hypothetical protein KUG81_05150 [Gammaproteobacteria bacterium]|nr:hypothetical protein [Gammaproteobacteria bacterium]